MVSGARPQVLNEVFLAALNQFKQPPPVLTQNQQVARLYRKSLRTLLHWSVDRDVFNNEAVTLRARFDANRGVSDSTAQSLLVAGENELFSFTHPDPYAVCNMPGGTKFMRNPPPPMSACFPDGNLPKDAPTYEVNPDWSLGIPENGRNATGTVIIDFTKKSME